MILNSVGNIIKFLSLCVFTVSFSTNVSAVVIDFGTGLAGAGGTITDVNNDGTHIIGSDINIGALVAENTANDGTYAVDGKLNFDTDLNTISIVGTIAALSINTSTTLLSGSFTSWSFSDSGLTGVFQGSGEDSKGDELLNALGVPLDTQFEFFGFSLNYDIDQDGVGIAVNTDIINNSTVVPVPASIWLFGTGLLGLVGVSRRRL